MSRNYAVLIPLIALLLTASISASKLSGEDKPNEISPEMLKLKHLLGTWDEVVELPDGEQLTAVGKTKWVLGGSYIQSSYVLKSPDGKQLQQMSLIYWDAKSKQYRGWMFSDQGENLESTGKLDEEKQMLTLSTQRDANGQKMVTEMKFALPDKVEWSVVSYDRNGNITLKLSGVDTRRTESNPKSKTDKKSAAETKPDTNTTNDISTTTEEGEKEDRTPKTEPTADDKLSRATQSFSRRNVTNATSSE